MSGIPQIAGNAARQQPRVQNHVPCGALSEADVTSPNVKKGATVKCERQSRQTRIPEKNRTDSPWALIRVRTNPQDDRPVSWTRLGQRKELQEIKLMPNESVCTLTQPENGRSPCPRRRREFRIAWRDRMRTRPFPLLNRQANETSGLNGEIYRCQQPVAAFGDVEEHT